MSENKKPAAKKSPAKKTTTKKATTAKKTTAKATTSPKAATKKTGATKKVENKKTVNSTKKATSKAAPKKTVVKEEAILEKEVVKEEVISSTEDKKTIINTSKTEEIRVIIMLSFIGVLVLLFIASAIITNKKADQIVAKVKELKMSDTTEVIYLMKEECQYCEINKPNMEALKDTYGVDYYEVDVAAIGSERRNKIADEFGLNPEKLSTPTLVLTRNNEVLEVLVGVQAFDEMFNTLKSYSLISENENLHLNYIDYAGYKKVLASKTPQILVLTSTTCHFCIEERPVLEEIAKEYGVNINWIYLNGAFNTQEEYDEFNNSLKWFEENSNWGTPTTLIVQNGEVISALSGYREKDDIIKFYKQNNLISE